MLGLAVLVCLSPMSMAAPVAIGVDDFEDGTTQNWIVAAGPFGATHPAPPDNVPDGGPMGNDDNFLLLRSLGGDGPGSRLSVINLAQWAGDYIAAQIPGIRMDVRNFGTTDLYLRLLVADPIPGPPQNEAFSTDPVVVPAGSDWMPVFFPLAPGSLTAGAGNVITALTNATELRLFHNPDAAFPPPPVEAELGIDNITAVPEPTTMLLLGGGLLALGFWRKRCMGRA